MGCLHWRKRCQVCEEMKLDCSEVPMVYSNILCWSMWSDKCTTMSKTVDHVGLFCIFYAYCFAIPLLLMSKRFSEWNKMDWGRVCNVCMLYMQLIIIDPVILIEYLHVRTTKVIDTDLRVAAWERKKIRCSLPCWYWFDVERVRRAPSFTGLCAPVWVWQKVKVGWA